MSTEQRPMSGKTVMITGASNGIGRAAAIRIAGMGAKLILVCRNRQRGEDAIRQIATETGNRDVRLMLADLSSQAEVKQLAKEFLAKGEPLHVLLNNAGIFNLKYEKSTDGIEKVYATNHLAYFILTQLLLDRIKECAPSRIVNVTSRGHKWAKNIYPISSAFFNGFHAYGGAKLCNILYTRDLARRLDGTGVTVNCTHPGDIETGLARNNEGWPQLLLRAMRPYFSRAESGADTPVYLASSPDVEHVSGEYFVKCKPTRSSEPSYDLALGQELRAFSFMMTGLSDED